MREQNPVLGHWACPQGGRAEVYQTKKAGRHFYTRCVCCGLVQGTGAALQQRIFDEADFLPGVNFAIPANVVQGGRPVIEGEKPGVLGPGPAADAGGDFDPAMDQIDSADTVNQDAAQGPRLGILAPLAVFATAVGVAWWTN